VDQVAQRSTTTIIKYFADTDMDIEPKKQIQHSDQYSQYIPTLMRPPTESDTSSAWSMQTTSLGISPNYWTKKVRSTETLRYPVTIDKIWNSF